MAFDLNIIKDFYNKMPELINSTRNKLHRPLTLTEKILYSHLSSEFSEDYNKENYSIGVQAAISFLNINNSSMIKDAQNNKINHKLN